MKTASRILPLLFAAALTLAAACGRSTFDAQVERAEELMDSAPDSALAIAEVLKPGNRAEQARAALLLTKARYKAYVPLTDDSLISIAANYYSGRNDSLETQALFLLGETFFTLDKYNKALFEANKAENIANVSNDYLYRGLAQRLQAETYMMCYDFRNELRSRQNAIESFAKAKKQTHLIWELLSKYISIHRCGKTYEAIDSINLLLESTPDLPDGLEAQALRAQAVNYYTVHDCENAINILNKLSNLEKTLSSQELSLLARAYSEQGRTTDVPMILSKALEVAETRLDSCCILLAKSMEDLANGNYKGAYDNYVKQDSLIGKEMDILLAHPYNSLLAETYKLQAEQNYLKNARLKDRLILWSIISILILFSLLIGFLYYKKNAQLNHQRLLKIRDNLEKLQKDFKTVELAANKMALDRDTLLVKRISVINILSTEIYMLPGHNKSDKTGILQRFFEIIDEFKNDETFKFIEDYLNRKYNNIVRIWDKECFSLSSKHRSLFLFCALGMTNETIAILTGSKSVNGVLSAKSRLKKLIEDLDFNSKTLVISLISSRKRDLENLREANHLVNKQ